MEIKLNEGQRKAAFSENKYNRVIAGAGTGKTQIVAQRIKKLINDGVNGDEILCITFSKNGANEILSRAIKAIGYPVPGMVGTTFNALENEIALNNWKKFGYRHRMSVIDDVQDLSMCDELLKRNPIYEWTGPSFSNYTQTKSFNSMPSALKIMSEILHEIPKVSLDKDPSSISASDLLNVESVKVSGIGNGIINKIIAMYPEYEKMKKGLDIKFTSPIITFDEQIILAMKVLNDDPNYLDDNYNFAHIIVDEAQDTSEYQIRFLNHLINMKKFKTLTLVGDDSQAIYESLMNTSPQYLINLGDYLYKIHDDGSRESLDIEDIVVDVNYRCQSKIIDLANKIIEKNKFKIEKDLIAFRPPLSDPTVEGFYRKNTEVRSKNSRKKGPIEEGQYDKMAKDIKKLIDKGVDPNDIACIAFSKNELKNIGDKLTSLNIPSKFGFPEYLMENSRVIALLKLVLSTYSLKEENDMDVLEITNALCDGELFKKEKSEINTSLEKVREKINEIYKANDSKLKKEYLDKFINEISNGDEAVLSFKDKFIDMDYDEIYRYCYDFQIFGDNMMYKRSVLGDGVMLITAHSSKGLEWKYVFASLNSFETESMTRAKVEEMRRLLFVTLTRARDELHIYGVYSAYGSKEKRVLNRFLKEVYDALGENYNPVFNDIK